MTYGMALGMNRCRFPSIRVTSPTADNVWIPSGNGPEGSGPRTAAVSSAKSSGVSRRIRFTPDEDRKSTRLNSSHRCISYAVFCLKKKKNDIQSQIYIATDEPLTTTNIYNR